MLRSSSVTAGVALALANVITHVMLSTCMLRTDQHGVAGQACAPVVLATAGDSITAGVRSSSADFSYPSQLQTRLDAAGTVGTSSCCIRFEVHNAGRSGQTMLRTRDYPYWNTPQYGRTSQSR